MWKKKKIQQIMRIKIIKMYKNIKNINVFPLIHYTNNDSEVMVWKGLLKRGYCGL